MICNDHGCTWAEICSNLSGFMVKIIRTRQYCTPVVLQIIIMQNCMIRGYSRGIFCYVNMLLITVLS